MANASGAIRSSIPAPEVFGLVSIVRSVFAWSMLVVILAFMFASLLLLRIFVWRRPAREAACRFVAEWDANDRIRIDLAVPDVAVIGAGAHSEGGAERYAANIARLRGGPS